MVERNWGGTEGGHERERTVKREKRNGEGRDDDRKEEDAKGDERRGAEGIKEGVREENGRKRGRGGQRREKYIESCGKREEWKKIKTEARMEIGREEEEEEGNEPV